MVYLKGDLKTSININTNVNLTDFKHMIKKTFNIQSDHYFLTLNGRLLDDTSIITNETIVNFSFRLNGGKGGFGSMLRAIGAQIEKTTNREACRDLSGRRLRDINEEKRLKNWIATQSDRARDATERKLKKIERLCAEPKHKFEDSEYDKIRSELPEKVSSAVEEGFKASESIKRKQTTETKTVQKKRKLWIDAELEDLDSSSEISSDEDDKNDKKHTISKEKNTQIIDLESPKCSNNEDDGSSSSSNDPKPSTSK